MKRFMLTLCVAAALAACGDGYNEGTSIDSSGINSSGDEFRPDTTILNNDTASYERQSTTPPDSK